MQDTISNLHTFDRLDIKPIKNGFLIEIEQNSTRQLIACKSWRQTLQALKELGSKKSKE